MTSPLAWPAIGTALAVVMGTAIWTGRAPMPLVSVREVKSSERTALQEKLTGPGYFSITRPVRMDENGRWIAPDDALGQVDRIVRSRHLDAIAAARLRRLVTAASEPHPSRAVGGECIMLSRLNLSLDALSPSGQHGAVSKVHQP